MNFCNICQSILAKKIRENGSIYFMCICGQETDGNPSDSLIVEEFLGTTELLQKEVFIDNSPYDLAAYVVMKECLQCHLDYLTLIRVGELEDVIYTCTCGYKATYDEYERNRKK